MDNQMFAWAFSLLFCLYFIAGCVVITRIGQKDELFCLYMATFCIALIGSLITMAGIVVPQLGLAVLAIILSVTISRLIIKRKMRDAE